MTTDQIDAELEVPADACVRPSRVRVTGRWNAPRLATADVRSALGLKRLAARLRRLDPADREDCQCCGAAAVTVSVFGLYRLLGRSRQPVCQWFLDWVAGTVVPGLRALYLSPPPPPPATDSGGGAAGEAVCRCEDLVPVVYQLAATFAQVERNRELMERFICSRLAALETRSPGGGWPPPGPSAN